MMNDIKNTVLQGNSGRCGLNGNQLRLIAVISMVIDHVGMLLWRYSIGEWLNTLHTSLDIYSIWFLIYYTMRMIGRMAFPSFAVFLVTGYMHTRDWKKYAVRLAVLAVISELPFDCMDSGKFGVDWTHQNTVFTLLLGLLLLKLLDTIPLFFIYAGSGPADAGGNADQVIQTAQLAAIVFACFVSWGLRFDYDFEGILLIVMFYRFWFDWKKACLVGAVWMAACSGTIHGVIGYVIAFILLYRYNGKQGNDHLPKWLTYGFYPLHLIILWICYVGLCAYLAGIYV